MSKRRGAARAAIVALTAATFTLLVVGAAISETGGPGDYTITVESPSSLDAGATGSVSLVIAPTTGQRISTDGPVRIAASVTPAEGLRLDSRRLRRKNARDPKARDLAFSIALAAHTAGRYQLALDIRFWVCGARTCRPVRERRQLEITVDGGAGPGDAGPVDSGSGAAPRPR